MYDKASCRWALLSAADSLTSAPRIRTAATPRQTAAAAARPKTPATRTLCFRAHCAARVSQGLAIGRHRLVGQPVLDVVGQCLGRGVAVFRPAAPWPSGRSPPAARAIVRIHCPRAAEIALPDLASGRCRCRRPRSAAGRSARSTRSPRGCRHRWPGRADPSVRRPAPGSCSAGVPRAEPICVAAAPLPDVGRSRPSTDSGLPSGRSTALASPQSTTSVSPYGPSMMLPGFRSRCSTPRLWA